MYLKYTLTGLFNMNTCTPTHSCIIQSVSHVAVGTEAQVH